MSCNREITKDAEVVSRPVRQDDLESNSKDSKYNRDIPIRTERTLTQKSASSNNTYANWLLLRLGLFKSKYFATDVMLVDGRSE
jgi:hypothetical protein